jgi:hypothetical protein
MVWSLQTHFESAGYFWGVVGIFALVRVTTHSAMQHHKSNFIARKQQ